MSEREQELGSLLSDLRPVLPEVSKLMARDCVREILARRNGRNGQENHARNPDGQQPSLSEAGDNLEAGYYGGLEDARAAVGETLRGIEPGIVYRAPDPRFNFKGNGSLKP